MQCFTTILPAGRMDGNYDGRQRQRNLAVVPLPGTNWQTPCSHSLSPTDKAHTSLPLRLRLRLATYLRTYVRSTTCLPASPTTVGLGYASSFLFRSSDRILRDATAVAARDARLAAISLYPGRTARCTTLYRTTAHRTAPHRTATRRVALCRVALCRTTLYRTTPVGSLSGRRN